MFIKTIHLKNVNSIAPRMPNPFYATDSDGSHKNSRR